MMKLIEKSILSIICFLCAMQVVQAQPIAKANDQEVIINSDYLAEWMNSQKNLHEMDKKKYDLQNFTSMKDGQDQFSYYILKEVHLISGYKSFLIYEYYESESFVYLVNYDKDGKYIDSLVVFYDNAEGAWQTSSVIDLHKKTIRIKEYNAYNDPEDNEPIVNISANGKFKK